MQNYKRRIEIVWANQSKIIASEIIGLRQDQIIDYIATMSSELATMAATSELPFLGYLLNLASAEAENSRSSSSRTSAG